MTAAVHSQLFAARAVLIAATMVLAAGALAQGMGVAELANYAGADRTQRLLDGAKKEGGLTLYTSMQLDMLKPLAESFEAKYGIKVKVWRGSGEAVLQRMATETKAGRFDVDATETDSTILEAMYREKLLQAMTTPVAGMLMDKAVMAHKSWIGTRMNIITAAYNTKLVKREDLPARYEDLLDAKWKGKLGIEADDHDWFATVVGAMANERGSAEKGIELFRNIVAANGVSVRKGHTLIANLVAAGEIPFAITVYVSRLEIFKRDGAPVDFLVLKPAVARVNGIALAAKAKNPHAALLYIDFVLTEGQEIMAKREYFPTNPAVRKVPDAWGITLTDAAKMLDEGEKWEKIYKETIRAK